MQNKVTIQIQPGAPVYSLLLLTQVWVGVYRRMKAVSPEAHPMEVKNPEAGTSQRPSHQSFPLIQL